MEAGGERTAERRLEEAWKSLESALALQNKELFTSSSTTASGAGPEQRTKPSASSSKNTLARLVEGSLLPLTKLSNEVWRSIVGEAGDCSGGSAPAVTPETIRNRIINAASRKAYVQHTNSTVDEFEEDANSPWLRWELRCMRDLTSKSEREACVRLRKATKMAAKLHARVRSGKGKKEQNDALVLEVEAMSAGLEAGSAMNVASTPAKSPAPPALFRPSPGASGGLQTPAKACALASPTQAAPPSSSKKRSRMTPEEKERKRLQKEADQRAREEEKERKRLQKEADQRAREEEKERKRLQKEAEQRAREEEKERKRQQKEAEQRAKEEAAARRAAEEEKRAKERKAKNLSLFAMMGVKSKNRAGEAREADPGSAGTKAEPKAPLLAGAALSNLDESLAIAGGAAGERPAADLVGEMLRRARKAGEASRSLRAFGRPPPFSTRRAKGSRRQGGGGVSVALVPSALLRNQEEEEEGAASLAEVQEVGGRRTKGRRSWRRKLLQFCENRRPAYYGSFSQLTSQRRPRRNPQHRYLGVDYDVDSDEEWCSEPEGEDLMDFSDGEEEGLEADLEDHEDPNGFRFVVSDDDCGDGEGGGDEDESGSEFDEDFDPEDPEGLRCERDGRQLERLVCLAQRRATKMVVEDAELLSVLDPVWLSSPQKPKSPAAATADAEEGAVAGQASPGEAKAKVAVEEEGEAEAGDPHKRQVKEAEKERKGGTPKGKGRGSPDAKGRQLRMTDFKQPACSLSGAEQDSQPPSQQNEARAAPQVVALD